MYYLCNVLIQNNYSACTNKVMYIYIRSVVDNAIKTRKGLSEWGGGGVGDVEGRGKDDILGER